MIDKLHSESWYSNSYLKAAAIAGAILVIVLLGLDTFWAEGGATGRVEKAPSTLKENEQNASVRIAHSPGDERDASRDRVRAQKNSATRNRSCKVRIVNRLTGDPVGGAELWYLTDARGMRARLTRMRAKIAGLEGQADNIVKEVGEHQVSAANGICDLEPETCDAGYLYCLAEQGHLWGAMEFSKNDIRRGNLRLAIGGGEEWRFHTIRSDGDRVPGVPLCYYWHLSEDLARADLPLGLQRTRLGVSDGKGLFRFRDIGRLRRGMRRCASSARIGVGADIPGAERKYEIRWFPIAQPKTRALDVYVPKTRELAVEFVDQDNHKLQLSGSLSVQSLMSGSERVRAWAYPVSRRSHVVIPRVCSEASYELILKTRFAKGTARVYVPGDERVTAKVTMRIPSYVSRVFHVRKGEGSPLAGALLRFNAQSGRHVFWSQSRSTDAAGRVRLAIPPTAAEMLTCSTDRGGWFGQFRMATILFGSAKERVLLLRRYQSFSSGVAVDEQSGQTIEGAQFAILGTKNAQRTFVLTQSGGSYQVNAGKDPIPAQLSIVAPGFETLRAELVRGSHRHELTRSREKDFALSLRLPKGMPAVLVTAALRTTPTTSGVQSLQPYARRVTRTASGSDLQLHFSRVPDERLELWLVSVAPPCVLGVMPVSRGQGQAVGTVDLAKYAKLVRCDVRCAGSGRKMMGWVVAAMGNGLPRNRLQVSSRMEGSRLVLPRKDTELVLLHPRFRALRLRVPALAKDLHGVLAEKVEWRFTFGRDWAHARDWELRIESVSREFRPDRWMALWERGSARWTTRSTRLGAWMEEDLAVVNGLARVGLPGPYRLRATHKSMPSRVYRRVLYLEKGPRGKLVLNRSDFK